jgi:hypothetical protein
MSIDYAVVNERNRSKLLELLMDMRWHKPSEMRKAGGVRYSARLLELKRLGYKFDDRPLAGEQQGKEYILICLVPGTPQQKRAKVYLDEGDLSLLVSGYTIRQLSAAGARELRRGLVSYKNNKAKL